MAMTKQELLEAIKDVDDDAEIIIEVMGEETGIDDVSYYENKNEIRILAE